MDRRRPLLAVLLFLTAALTAVILWVPMAACPACDGVGVVTGLGQVVREESGLQRRQVRKTCGECDARGRISVLRKWRLRP